MRLQSGPCWVEDVQRAENRGSRRRAYHYWSEWEKRCAVLTRTGRTWSGKYGKHISSSWILSLFSDSTNWKKFNNFINYGATIQTLTTSSLRTPYIINVKLFYHADMVLTSKLTLIYFFQYKFNTLCCVWAYKTVLLFLISFFFHLFSWKSVF